MGMEMSSIEEMLKEGATLTLEPGDSTRTSGGGGKADS